MADTSLNIPVNAALFTSGQRIYGHFRWATLAESNPAIPPDVATAADELRRRHLVQYASVVSAVRPYEARLNDQFGAKAGLQSGQSLLDPLYAQYTMLESTPPLADYADSIWYDMPPEMYLANRSDLSADERAILADLGYTASLTSAGKGESPFLSDESEITKSANIREAVFGSEYKTAKTWVSAIAESGQLLKVVAGWGALAAGAYTVYVGVPALFDYWKQARASEAAVALAASDAKRAEFQLRMADENQKVTDACLAWARSTGAGMEKCVNFQQSLPQQVLPSSLSEAMSAGVCGTWTTCSTWLLLGTALGAYAGWMASQRLFNK